MKELNFEWMSLKEAIDVLKQYKSHNCPAYGMFRGTKITTEMSEDEIYAATGVLTPEQQEDKFRKWQEEYDRELEEYKKTIPGNTEKWIQWGHENLAEEVLKDWDYCVPIRLGDLYRGMELDCFKEIFEAYRAGKTAEEIKEIFYNQGHSGMSARLECSIVATFLDKELGNYLYNS